MKKKLSTLLKHLFLIILLVLITLIIFLTLKSKTITSEKPIPVSFEVIDSAYSKEAESLIS